MLLSPAFKHRIARGISLFACRECELYEARILASETFGLLQKEMCRSGVRDSGVHFSRHNLLSILQVTCSPL
jgi:hypothetical protein